MILECRKTLKEIKQSERYISAQIKNFEKSHRAEFINAAEILNTAVKSIKEVDIPHEVKVTKGIDLKSGTRQFLAAFAIVSTFVIALCLLGVGYYKNQAMVVEARYSKQIDQAKKLERQERQIEWYDGYVKNSMEKTPKTHDKFLEKFSFPE